MNFLETPIPGCYTVGLEVHTDSRGQFVKLWKQSAYSNVQPGLASAETYYTLSGENVLRGMHLQLPPLDYSKLVCCAAGEVLDVILDLRRGSPAYGSHLAIEMSGGCGYGLLLPSGIAHGFYVRKAPAMMVYQVSREHSPGCDAGVAWDSFGFEWPSSSPKVSVRDAGLPALRDFESPFWYEESELLESNHDAGIAQPASVGGGSGRSVGPPDRIAAW